MVNKKTIKDFGLMKAKGEKITVLTAYDAGTAALLSFCDVDMLLVGDSLGNVVLGYDSTVPVTMEEMLHHCKAVRRGAPDAFVVGDMPFGSYQVDPVSALTNATRFLKEAGADAVKLEGGVEVCETVRAMVNAGISVVGHIGLTPQTAGQLGGYKVQGKDKASARRLYREIQALEEAGAFAVVIECVPAELTEILTAAVSIPIIGIGAGAACDGQVLVINDMFGMSKKFTPSFVKRYADLAPLMEQAVRNYVEEVREGRFPDEQHSFSSPEKYEGIEEE